MQATPRVTATDAVGLAATTGAAPHSPRWTEEQRPGSNPPRTTTTMLSIYGGP